MNNEDRIVELLAESLRNQDIQSDKLETVSSDLEKVNSNLEKVNSKLDALVDVVKDLAKSMQAQASIMERLMEKFNKVDDLEHRVFLLEKERRK